MDILQIFKEVQLFADWIEQNLKFLFNSLLEGAKEEGEEERWEQKDL